MEIKAIKSNIDYQEALKYVETVIDKGVEENSVESEKLEVLVTLIQHYESKMFPYKTPDPIDALAFVMEQRNLSHKDLVPYIGSRSKVSEVLSRKRPLSLNMIRSLHKNLGIPAKTLLNQSRSNDATDLSDERFPIKDTLKSEYVNSVASHFVYN